jgi:cytochrome c-type biogenesis protein CcmH/NrfG
VIRAYLFVVIAQVLLGIVFFAGLFSSDMSGAEKFLLVVAVSLIVFLMNVIAWNSTNDHARTRRAWFRADLTQQLEEPKRTIELPDRRREARIRFERRVILENATGEMRDMSESGSTVFFYTDGTYAFGDVIGFAIESPVYDQLGAMTKKSMVKCRGVVVRTEAHDNRMGVAVKITEPVVEPSVHVMS